MLPRSTDKSLQTCACLPMDPRLRGDDGRKRGFVDTRVRREGNCGSPNRRARAFRALEAARNSLLSERRAGRSGCFGVSREFGAQERNLRLAQRHKGARSLSSGLGTRSLRKGPGELRALEPRHCNGDGVNSLLWPQRTAKLGFFALNREIGKILPGVPDRAASKSFGDIGRGRPRRDPRAMRNAKGGSSGGTG